MNKRTLVLTLLVIVLALPLSASGQEMVSAPGEFPIVEEPITLNILMLGTPLVEDFSTNTFTDWYSERTGINLDFDIAPPNEGTEVLNLTIASGDLPDIIVGFGVDQSTLALFGPQGLFLPLSGLIEEHGHYIHEVFAGSPQVRRLVTAPDGEIYGLPQVNECYQCFYSQRAWINSDWLANVGMDVPQTTEEFFDVLMAFKEQDANGNGDPNDEIPLAAATTNWNPNIDGFLMNPFVFSEYAGQNRFFEQNDGVITENVTSEGYREGLRYLNRLFEAGLFGEESFTQPMDQVRQQVEGGDAPTIGTVIAGGPHSFANIGGDRWQKYVAVPALEGPSGLRQVPYSPWSISSGQCTISSRTEHPVAAFKWCDGLYERETTLRSVIGVPQWEAAEGEEGQWRWAEEGEPALGGDEFEAIWRRLSTFGSLQNAHWAQRGPSYRSNAFRLGEVLRKDAAGLAVVLLEETRVAYAPYARDIEDLIPPLALTSAQAAEVTDLRLSINDFVAQMTAEFVLGRQDLDAGWDNFVATLDSLGINRMVEIYQTVYDEQYGE
ncbi:MAG: extracellular solute-binding protein [Chloroflexi bacterium]|nr:extracellular solute-binding protein [Chloroflexota bacterium]MCY4247248.1 extracellular solute-binding protein [Chloroflexota bacterium]